MLLLSGSGVAEYTEGISSAEPSAYPATLEDVSSHQHEAEKPLQRSYIFSMKCNAVLFGAWPFGDQLPLLGGGQKPTELSCLVFGQAEGRRQHLCFIMGFPFSVPVLICLQPVRAAFFKLLHSYSLG